MTNSILFTNGRLIDGALVDIAVQNGLIAWIGSPSQCPVPCGSTIDFSGFIVSSPFVEPHAHLDKAFLADRISNPAGDLMGAIKGLEEVRTTITHQDIVERATRAVKLMSQNGVTSIRTHADTTLSGGLSSVHALLEVKQECSHFMDIQVAMLLEWPITGIDGKERQALARDAIAAGVDVVGGCPHLDPDPRGAVEFLLGLAIDSGLPLDLHADENMRPDSTDLEHLADVVIRDNVSHQVNASHCVSLSTRSEYDIDRIAAKAATGSITITALPQTNLYLQERGVSTNPARAITPIHRLQQAGVVVAAGADNLQDPFNLVGRGDPLEIASLLMISAHSTANQAIQMVTSNAHRAVHGVTISLAVGERADFAAIPATNLRESIAMGPPDRIVVYGGVVIDNQIRNRK
ncbi:MAG: amidohydrolase family protein [Ilumatobacteraceae bacterium]|nr:amidohydrolase family protein [Ilumatobacteraceae bacterium]